MPFLAAISFSDPFMLAGLLAALVPVVLHLLNRMKAPVIPFPTLRFLKLTAEKTARRRQIQQYFLLLVRIIVFALIAMAVASPLIRGGSAGLAYGFVGLILLGLALLVFGGAMASSRSPVAHPTPLAASRPVPRASRVARRWFLALAAFLAALLLGGYAAYGLASDHYFSGDRGEFSGRSTALVIIFDNSHSMLATDEGQTRLARAKAQVRRLLNETLQPAEAAVLPTNPGAAAAPGLTIEMTRLGGYLDGLTPRGPARPMQERIGTALEMLHGSSQPSKMLLIVSDFTQYPFSDAAVFAPLKTLPWRKDLQLVFMPIAGADEAGGIADAGIATFAPAAGTQRPALGAEITFEAQLVNNRPVPDARDLQLTVDGNPVEAAMPRVTLAAAGTQGGIARFTYRLARPGPHTFDLGLRDNQDAMAWNDHRTLVLDVADQVHVLVIGPQPPDARGLPPARSAAFYFLAALAPYDAKSGIPWSIKPAYAGIDILRNAPALAGSAAVFVCDVPRITAPQADALAAYAKSDGRIIWVLGPSVDASSYNATLLAPARGLLPAPLAQPLSVTRAVPLQWVDTQAGIFGDLFDSQDPFHSVLVTGRWALAPPPSGTQAGMVLAKLADESPLLIQHVPAGTTRGRVYTLLTTPAASWSNLGATVLLVPLASRMAWGDFQELGPTSYQEGEPANITAPNLRGTATTIDVTLPDGGVINVKPTGQANWIFDRTYADGTYRWKTTDGKASGAFQVNPPGEEADLSPANVPALATEANPPPGAGAATIVASTPDELLAQLQRHSEGTSLAPGFVAMVLMLAVVESLLANRRAN